MTFDYSASVWGTGTATVSIGDPTSIRLRAVLDVLAPLEAGERILEIGCGAGQFIRAIKKIRPELECHGSDISKPALQIAEKNNDGVMYSEQSGNNLPYADRLFSAAVIFDVLEHVDKPEELLCEINRVLRPGGKLYAFVPCEGDALSLWHFLRFFGIGAYLTKKFAGHIQYFSRRSLFQLVSNCGFRIISKGYSEHFLGQMLGIITFVMMYVTARKQKLDQMNNETFFTEHLSKGRWRGLRKLGNSLIFFESRLFNRVPSSNVHLVGEKQ